MFTNFLHGLNLQLGYTAPQNEDCEVRGNVVIGGDLTLHKFKSVVNEGNLVVARDQPRPRGVRVILRPNKYDSARAHLAIYNFQGSPAVDVDASGFLKPGDTFRLMNPREFYGKPLLTGTFEARPIPVPMNGEFAVFVLLKEPGR